MTFHEAGSAPGRRCRLTHGEGMQSSGRVEIDERGGRGVLRDDWDDPAFAADWVARHEIGNPSRRIQLAMVTETLRLLALRARRPITILELGSGSGILAERVLDAIADGRVEGVDKSPAMTAMAATRLARFGARFRQTAMDLTAFDAGALAHAPYDAVVAMQSLHELSEADQRRVFDSVRRLLRRGGLFLYADRITPDLDRFWLPHEAVWTVLCDVGVAAGQPTFAERVLRVRSKADGVVPLRVTLRMLRDAGFVAEPILVAGERAVIAACADAAGTAGERP